MLVLQQLKVLPAGARFIICDMGNCELVGKIAESDKSIIFDSPYDAEKYNKVYSTFKVAELNVTNNAFCNTFIIEVRG